MWPHDCSAFVSVPKDVINQGAFLRLLLLSAQRPQQTSLLCGELTLDRLGGASTLTDTAIGQTQCQSALSLPSFAFKWRCNGPRRDSTCGSRNEQLILPVWIKHSQWSPPSRDYWSHTDHYVNSSRSSEQRKITESELFGPCFCFPRCGPVARQRDRRSSTLPLRAPHSPTINYALVKFRRRHLCSLSGASVFLLPAASLRTET